MIEQDDILSDEMLPAERRQRLIDWFRDNAAGSSQDLAQMFSVSVSTIRRDLDLLASEGLVQRTHGGAVRIRSRSTFELSTDQSRRVAVEEKQAIVREAMKLIEPEQSLLIDTGGVIAHILADQIALLDMPLTVVTNDLYVANALTYRENIKLIVPGGTCRYGSYSLLGEPGLSFLSDIRCEIFFMSTQAIDEECASETNLDLVQQKRAMIQSASTVVLIADSVRFAARALYKTAPIEDIDLIITDEGLAEEDRERYHAAGHKLLIAAM